MTELVQAFRFRVQLSLSLPGRNQAPPPDLNLSDAPDRGAPARQQGPGADGASPLSIPGGGDSRRTQTLGDGGFQEVTGLDVEADLKDYLEGGANDTTIRRVGRLKSATLVLKRGMMVPVEGGQTDASLWTWLQDMVAGSVPVPRYDGIVDVLAPGNARAVARWTFTRGLPLKVVGPALHAATGALAIEELHIQHEGLRLETVT